MGHGLVVGLGSSGWWLDLRSFPEVFSNLDSSTILLSSQCHEHCKGRCPKTSTTGLIPPFSSVPELQYPSFKRITCPSGPRDSCECLWAGGKKEGGTSLVWMKWKLPRVVNTLTTSEHFQWKIQFASMHCSEIHQNACTIPTSRSLHMAMNGIGVTHRFKEQHIISPGWAETACLITVPCILCHSTVAVINEPEFTQHQTFQNAILTQPHILNRLAVILAFCFVLFLNQEPWPREKMLKGNCKCYACLNRSHSRKHTTDILISEPFPPPPNPVCSQMRNALFWLTPIF